MIKVLWISAAAPYDAVPHAGGQIHNYYIKELKKNETFDIQLISFYTPDYKDKLDLDEYGIKNNLICRKRSGLEKIYWGIIRRFDKYNIFDKNANLSDHFIEWGILTSIEKLVGEGFIPDIVILQWTQIVLQIGNIKQMIPDASYVSIEEDVSYLSYLRKRDYSRGFIKRSIWNYKYSRLKLIEQMSLQKSDLVIYNNVKDRDLVAKDSCLMDTWVWCPYFNNMLSLSRGTPNNDIIFYGAMDREENWRSAIWFIENVFCNIERKDIRFVVIGNKPNQKLKSYENDRIKIQGFVEDISPFFETSLCMVAPLVLGAGVKIKVLEGLSSGIPVLTNGIGIEGINAVDGQDFFYCETPNDYIETINMLLEETIDIKTISSNSKRFISKNYDFHHDAYEFAERLIQLNAKK